MKALSFCFVFLLLSSFLKGQNVGINSTGLPPHSSAMLDVSSSNKGFLITRVDPSSITSPAFGLMTLSPLDSCLYMYSGATWQGLGGSGCCCPVNGHSIGTIKALNCTGGILIGSLTQGTAATGVSFSIPYKGGNGGNYNGQTVTSTGVLGLTATLDPGNFTTSTGNVTYTVTGIPASGGTAIFALNIGGKTCNFSISVTSIGTITTLSCAGVVLTGTLTEGTPASGVSFSVPYVGGNAGAYSAQTVISTGVTGLTASLVSGVFALGAGSVVYTVSGTAVGNGTASFALSLGGQSCSVTVAVSSSSSYPTGFVNCGSATVIKDVTSPTGQVWMDRNLGASQVATSATDALSYGDYFQWGRFADGHQCIASAIVGPVPLATVSIPNIGNTWDGKFIKNVNSPSDWLSPADDNLWQISGINNPCPSGYRIPTKAEMNSERLIFSTHNVAGAFNSILKLPAAGYRRYNVATTTGVGSGGFYWTTTINGTNAWYLNSSTWGMLSFFRANGMPIRCIKN